ncbi:MAG: hypothetical protein QNK33_11005, partial [Bacteroidales bacterium]|nr:hypothetical protein [Bacteroidales bacterium]
MKRRQFISKGIVITGGSILAASVPISCRSDANKQANKINSTELYTLFKNPTSKYHPFVRWWWNGNMITREEITRELLVLK